MQTTRRTRFPVAVLAAASALVVCALPNQAQDAQAPGRVDFVRDVQPLLRQSCISCHGPAQQMAGLRLDRRRDAMRGSTLGAVIKPTNGDASPMYLRVSGDKFGLQMPPTGKLTAAQVALLKAWIDQGADWPDAAAGDAPAIPPDPGAVRLLALLRAGDRAAFSSALSAEPAAANRRGTDGISPLMQAALYGDVAAMRALLDAGADPNTRNDAGATALMWAADTLDKTRLLIERGADVNVRSNDGRTPAIIAAAQAGSSGLLTLLLDSGANPNVEANGMTPLAEAAYAADLPAMKLLIARGADPRRGLQLSAYSAAVSDCRACLALLLASAEPASLPDIATVLMPPNDDGDDLALVLDRGAAVDAKDREGRSLLMLAAASDRAPASTIQRLLASGADPQARGAHGETALGFARMRGSGAVVDLLLKANAPEMAPPPAATVTLDRASSPRAAIERALPLLQRTGVTFRRKAGCVSCHNNTLTALSVLAARRAGVVVDENVRQSETIGIGQFLEIWRERAIQGVGIPGDADTVSNLLLGLAEEQYPATAATDAMARFLRRRQLADGSWRIVAHRPPIESSDFAVTAASMRALQVYAPAPHRAIYAASVASAVKWLLASKPLTTEDRAWQLLAFRWAGQERSILSRAARALAAQQRADGGWAQLATLGSDAYATGEALVALADSGAMSVGDPAYQRGVNFLLATQFPDGSWHVPTRALSIQPLFDIGFPHGDDSWISAAGTNWATMALARAAVRPLR